MDSCNGCRSYHTPTAQSNICADGFPQIDYNGVPFCCVETVCARLFPETGGPRFPVIGRAEHD